MCLSFFFPLQSCNKHELSPFKSITENFMSHVHGNTVFFLYCRPELAALMSHLSSPYLFRLSEKTKTCCFVCVHVYVLSLQRKEYAECGLPLSPRPICKDLCSECRNTRTSIDSVTQSKNDWKWTCSAGTNILMVKTVACRRVPSRQSPCWLDQFYFQSDCWAACSLSVHCSG